ncbi:MAG TPA: MBL fold metallo-hydrolase [Clostridiales bacterium]|nr:MBL fold metallo-hydrolase [Clostridiales bacterium]
MIKVEKFILGDYMENCYLITDADTGEQALIDPGYESMELFQKLSNNHENNLKYILLTHGHFDHIGFVLKVYALTHAKIAIGEKEKDFLTQKKLNLSQFTMTQPLAPIDADILLKNNELLPLGNSSITYVSTPGHTQGSGCYIVDNNIFTGDTLMKCSMGRTDFPTGNDTEMKHSLHKISELTKNYTIYPGHGDNSTLDYEKSHNPYLGVL